MPKKAKKEEKLPAIAQSKFIRELGNHIRASYPFIYVVTDEHDRLMDEIQVLAESYLAKETKSGHKFNVYRWTCTESWTSKSKKVPKPSEEEPPTPNGDFMKIKEFEPLSIFVMENFHFFMTRENPDLIQMVRDLVHHCNEKNKCVVFANNLLEVPTELESHITVMNHDLPVVDDIVKTMDSIIDIVKDKKVDLNLNEEKRYKTIESLKGMRLGDIENALAYSIVTTKTFDPKVLLAEKCKSIRKAGMLEYVQSTESPDQIGGLENLKEWINLRKIAFTSKAKQFHLRPSKGVLVVGVPGCGKSLTAKASATMLGCPLIRFDLGEVFSKYVGESEQRIRKALQMVDAVSPCVLWIDEIEKGMAGAGSSGSMDSGVSPRVFGTFLQWLNEHTSAVFVIATSNNLDSIPVEFTRKGRFDEVFFVDIPNKTELKDIFRIQFSRQNLKPEKYDIDKLVESAGKFTGAEVERAIDEAKIVAANRGEVPTTEDVIAAMSEILPEAKKNKAKIETIRQRAAQIAINASKPEKDDPKEVKAGGSRWKAIDA